MTTLRSCDSLENLTILPSIDSFNEEKVEETSSSSDNSPKQDSIIAMSPLNADLELEDNLSDSFKSCKPFISLEKSSSSKSELVRDQPDLKKSENESGVTLEDQESLQLMFVEKQSLNLSKILPSLSEGVKLENENSCQLLENLIRHSIAFIYERGLPAISALEDLEKQFYVDTMKSQHEIYSLSRKKLLLEAEIQSSYDANMKVNEDTRNVHNNPKKIISKLPSKVPFGKR